MKRSIVLIEWTDSHGATASWEYFEDAKEPEGCVCSSVGIVQAESETAYRLVPHWIDKNDTVEAQGCGAMVIPKIAVRRFVHLFERDEPRLQGASH